MKGEKKRGGENDSYIEKAVWYDEIEILDREDYHHLIKKLH